jgi:hypothetical protein
VARLVCRSKRTLDQYCNKYCCFHSFEYFVGLIASQLQALLKSRYVPLYMHKVKAGRSHSFLTVGMPNNLLMGLHNVVMKCHETHVFVMY